MFLLWLFVSQFQPYLLGALHNVSEATLKTMSNWWWWWWWWWYYNKTGHNTNMCKVYGIYHIWYIYAYCSNFFQTSDKAPENQWACMSNFHHKHSVAHMGSYFPQTKSFDQTLCNTHSHLQDICRYWLYFIKMKAWFKKTASFSQYIDP